MIMVLSVFIPFLEYENLKVLRPGWGSVFDLYKMVDAKMQKQNMRA